MIKQIYLGEKLGPMANGARLLEHASTRLEPKNLQLGFLADPFRTFERL